MEELGYCKFVEITVWFGHFDYLTTSELTNMYHDLDHLVLQLSNTKPTWILDGSQRLHASVTMSKVVWHDARHEDSNARDGYRYCNNQKWAYVHIHRSTGWKDTESPHLSQNQNLFVEIGRNKIPVHGALVKAFLLMMCVPYV
ncbi:hypothetical protein ACET3Z_006245 [Daucus carota]